MCGLYGMLGDMTYKDKDTLRVLAALSIFRGEDSAGFIRVPTKAGDEPSITKTLGTSYDLFDTKGWDRLSTSTSKAVIGHTRKATVGGVSKRAAQPFDYGHIFGVHNGTLDHWRWKSLPCGEEVTDSATLYKSVSEIGIKDTIEQIAGAYALVWYDTEADTINFLRNNQRSLFYAFSSDYKRMIWASEPWMIHVAVQKTDFDYADLSAKDAEEPIYVVPFETDTLFRVKVGVPGKSAITFLEDEKIEGDVKKPAYRAPFRSSSSSSPPPNPFPGVRQQQQQQQPLTGNYAASGASQPPVNQQAGTPAAAASTTTSSPTSSATSTTSTSTASQSQRPTLSLVHDSKNAGSASSTSDRSSGQTGQKTDIILVDPDDDVDDIGIGAAILTDGFDNALTKEAWDKTIDSHCQFCQADVSYDDAAKFKACGEGRGVGRWLNRSDFVCSDCTPHC